MSLNIRRQSIISSIVVYIGFAVGLLNTYLFTKEGTFSVDQYGLANQFFMATATLMVSLASFAMPAYISKFYPYYNDHLPPSRNDMLTWALLVSLFGFLCVIIGGLALEFLFVRKYSAESPLSVRYYYWMFPFAFGLSIYNVLEAYAWNLNKSVFTNFLREVEWRLITTILIVLFILNIIPGFDLFIKLYAFTYPAIALTLLVYLLVTKKIHFTFQVSKVTRRLFKKIAKFSIFIYFGTLIPTFSLVFDTLVIASILPRGMEKAGIYGLAQLCTSLMVAPQRSIVSAAIPHLSKAWKDKRIGNIRLIYQRSSINLLLFAVLIYMLIALNYQDAIYTLHLRKEYLLGFEAFLILGLMRVIDMGTGVNAQIIGTSNYWKFELVSGAILLVFILPLNYYLTKNIDIVGTALANLVSITIYNSVRVIFLWKKFRLFPFTQNSLKAILLGAAVYGVSWFIFRNLHGFAGLFLRSIFILAAFGGGVFLLKLTPDLSPVLQSIINRSGLKK